MTETPPSALPQTDQPDAWSWSGAIASKLAAALLIFALAFAGLTVGYLKQAWQKTPIHWFACGHGGMSNPDVVEDGVAIDFASAWLESFYTFVPKTLKDKQLKAEKTLHPSILEPMKVQMAKELKDALALAFSSQLYVAKAWVKERRSDAIVIVALSGWRTAWQGSVVTRDQPFEAELGVVGFPANAQGMVIGSTKLPTALMVKPL